MFGVGTNALLRNLNDSMLSNLRTQQSYSTLFTFARRQIVKKKAEGIPNNQKTRLLGMKSGKYEKEELGDVRVNLVNKLLSGIRHCRINEKNVLLIAMMCSMT